MTHIGDGSQFFSDFVEVNPNSKTPALRDHICSPSIRMFESGSILLYPTERFGCFSPRDPAKHTETTSWLLQLRDAVPFLGGGSSHFYHYALVKIEYVISRFTMEAKRLFNVLGKQPTQHKFAAGDRYTIADTAIQPQFGSMVLGGVYGATEFLDTGSYKHVQRRMREVGGRPAAKRGRIVNRINGSSNERLYKRHDASDFETNTEDKRQG